MAKIFNTRKFMAAGLRVSLLIGFLFSAQVKAQTEPITNFPYQTSFGTTASPHADNALWKPQSAAGVSAQWKFTENPSVAGALTAAFEGNNQKGELYPTIFSPSFSFKKEEGTDYVFTFTCYVPTAGRLPNDCHYVIRVNKVDETGATISVRDIVTGKGFIPENMKDPIIKEDIAQSLWAGSIENGGPQEGSSTHEFRLKASELSVDGNYRLSITAGNITQFNTTCKLYISNFKVEKLSASDIEACQMLSPVSVTEENVAQQVQCYVRNVGAAAAKDIKAYYQVDNGRVVEQTLEGTLAPQETRLHTFAVPATLTAGVHKIKCWFKDDNDKNSKNDTTLTDAVKVANVGAFSNFDFLEEGQTYGWHAYSDTTEKDPLWRFVSQAPFYPQAKTRGEKATTHDDYLVSPWFELKKGKMYQVDLTIETILNNGEVLGEKSFSVWLANSNRKEDILEQKKLIWNAGVLRRKGERTMTLFFEAEKDTTACVVFRSNGPASDGSIRLKHFSLQQTRTNKMNLFYDFEPYTSSDAIGQAKEYMTFVDQDWNALVKEKTENGNIVTYELEPTVTSGWEVKKESLGYSAYVKGIQGQANDWLIFYPMELKAGKTYYLHFQARKQGSRVSATDGKCALEVYLQNTYPRYELPYAEQQDGWKKREEVTGTSAHLYTDTITVQKDGLYFLSIRNVTNTTSKIDTPFVYDNSIYVDDVMFAEQNFTSVQALEAQIPYEARLGNRVDMTMTVKNFSTKEISKDNISYCYRIDGHDVKCEHPLSNMKSMDHATYTFTNVDFSEDGDHVVSFWVETRGSNDIPDTVKVEVKRIYPKTLPYEDEFTASSLDEWQFYPSSLNSWILSTESSAVYSGTHCMSFRPGTTNRTVGYLVSPILKVEKDVPYRIAFRYKRERASEKTDSVRLYYAYNQFNLEGFKAMNRAFAVDSADYVLCTAYVRFPNDGKAYVAMGVDCAIGSSVLFIDDFSIADSVYAHSTQMILSNLMMPQGMSFCDTAAKGAVEFYVKNSSFLDVENMELHYEDATPGQKELHLGKIARRDSVKVRVPMGRRLEGEYAFKVWNVMPYELERSDDTLSGTFRVSGAKGFPFSENFEGVVEGTGAVDVNNDGMVWRILESGQQARTGSQCLNYPHKNALSGAVFFTDGFRADQTGRFKITFYMKADVEGNDGVGVRVMEYAPAGGFASSVYIDTLRAGTEYEQYNVPFHVESGKTYAIAFEYVANRASTEEGQAFFIDDLTTGDITEPVKPHSLAVVDTGAVTASFTCQNMAERNVLRVYSADGKFNQMYEWKKSQQKFEVKGLRPATEYRAQVRGLNEVNDSSAWSDPVRFVTLDSVAAATEKLQAGNRIRISPNPASERVQVELFSGADKWTLCNAGGRVVLNGAVTSTLFEINLQGLSAGMYFLRVEGKEGRTVTKIIKK